MATVIRSGIDATLATVDPTTKALQVKLSGTNYVDINPHSISTDAGGRLRVSQINTLFDGKILNADRPNSWDIQGTGGGTFSNNKYDMSVTSGQWKVRQSRTYLPYYSGKSQLIECTFDNFQVEANVTKRVGYFSSINTTPYATNYDGFFLENDGTTIRLRMYRNGVSTLDLPMSSWDNPNGLTYNWSFFTVIAFDFLWLGGAVMRFYIKTDLGFELMHTFNYSGHTVDTCIKSPNQPLRYEIRSSTGSGSFRYICSQVATEGSFDEGGNNFSFNSLSTAANPSNTIAAIGTNYPILIMKKRAGFRDNPVKFLGGSINLSSNTDIALWSMQINPVITGTIGAFTQGRTMEYANGSDTAAITATVTTPGHTIASGIITTGTVISGTLLEQDFLSYFGSTMDDVMDTYVLCVQPITSTITLNATMGVKEY